MKTNYNNIPTDYTASFKMDWNWDNDTWSNNATVINWTWVTANNWYQSEELSWGASTTFTYSSVTFTNSYVWIDWVFTKNSSKVTATAFNGTSWEKYSWLRMYNKTLNSSEERALELEWQRRLWDRPSYPALMNWIVAYYDFKWDANDVIWWNNWTVTGASLTTDHLGRSNSAYSFITNDRINIPNQSYVATDSFSYSVLFKTTKVDSNYHALLWLANSSENPWINLRITPEEILQWLVKGSSWTVVNSSWTVNDWNWHLATLTYDWSWNTELFLDWVSEDTSVHALSWNLYPSNQNDSIWAKWTSTILSYQFYFDWTIAFVMEQNKQLSLAEHITLYELTSKEYIYPFSKGSTLNLQDDLLLHLSWENNWTTTLYDISWNSKNWTVSSTPTYNRVNQTKTVSLSTQSISWTSTTFTTSTCWEKVSWVWELQVNPTYITSTWITSWTREIADIRLYNRTLTTNEQNQLFYLWYLQS